MTYNFCTLFDKNYIFRGLAMYYSLKRHCSNFKLWILCMDDVVYDQLQKMNLDSVELIKLSVLEDEELLKVKPGRTVAEYCWTLSSSLSLYVFKHNPELELVAYLDSDLYFYSSPESIFAEMGNKSIYIVRHNYSKELAYLEERSGIYNVSLVIIRNDVNGMACLNWWRARCLEWCYARLEDGKFGDQMYLNDWTTRFSGVKICKNKGVNLAPWNLNKYLIKQFNNEIFVDDDLLVFYHFHSFKMYGINDFEFYPSSYLISRHDEEVIYTPYVLEMNGLIKKINKEFLDYRFGFNQKPGIILRFKSFVRRKLMIIFYLLYLSKK